MENKQKPLSGGKKRTIRRREGRATESDLAAARQYKDNQQRINEIKLAKGCVDCGYNKHPAALDFDHLPEQLKCFSIANKTACCWRTIETEIAKCEVVCANCHRIRTAQRLQPLQPLVD